MVSKKDAESLHYPWETGLRLQPGKPKTYTRFLSARVN